MYSAAAASVLQEYIYYINKTVRSVLGSFYIVFNHVAHVLPSIHQLVHGSLTFYPLGTFLASMLKHFDLAFFPLAGSAAGVRRAAPGQAADADESISA